MFSLYKLPEMAIWRQSDIKTLLILQTKMNQARAMAHISVVDKEPVETLNYSYFIQSPAPHFYFDKSVTWL